VHGVEIEILREVTDQVVEAFARLLPQLSPAAGTGAAASDSAATRSATARSATAGRAAIDRATLSRVVGCEANTVLIARSEAVIIGTLTLVTVPTLTGVRARIEDVVVDEAARGAGAGEALTRRALELAAQAGAVSVELTSRASRIAANRLYRRLGFQPRESNLYRYPLG
jgi:ribosomal protein S18 acetylase RimI-like enzyme